MSIHPNRDKSNMEKATYVYIISYMEYDGHNTIALGYFQLINEKNLPIY